MAEGILPFRDLGKQQLLERCRELEFVDDVQDLKCTRCNRLALEHWYTNCGHALCSNCKRLLSSGGFKCPQCYQFIEHIEEQSTDFEKRLNGFRAKCPNSRYGCPLVTTVKQLQEHLVGCEWTKEQVLPAEYTGANTMQMLLDEVSSLKEQMSEMNGTNKFLLNELNERLKVEEEIKKSLEMSVADIKSHLNGLSSDLHFETTTLKAQTKNINFEQLQIHFPSKDEVKQQEQQLTKLDGKTNALFQMLDEKVDKFSQRLTKDIESINIKIKADEDKIMVMRNEDKISLDSFQDKQEVTVENYKQEILTNSKDLQSKVEKFNDDFKMEMHKLITEITLGLEQQGMSFNQKLALEVKQLEEKILKNESRFDEECKENGVKMETLISDLKKQEVVIMNQIHDNAKDLVSKENLNQLQMTVAEMNINNKFLIQLLDQKEDRFSQRLTKEFEEMNAKIVTSEGKMEAALTKSRQETVAISKELQGRVEKSKVELKAQLQMLSSELNLRLEQEKTSFNQKLTNEVKQLDLKINKAKTEVGLNRKEIDVKMEAIKGKIRIQEVELMRHIATNDKNIQEKIQGSIEELKQQLVKVKSDVTQSLKQEQLRCNKKLTEEIKAFEEKRRSKEEENDKRMNSEFVKMDVPAKNFGREMRIYAVSDLELRRQNENMKGKTDQLKTKESRMVKSLNLVSASCSAEVQVKAFEENRSSKENAFVKKMNSGFVKMDEQAKNFRRELGAYSYSFRQLQERSVLGSSFS